MQCETHRDPLENPPKDLTAIGSEKSNMTMLCFKKIFFFSQLANNDSQILLTIE